MMRFYLLAAPCALSLAVVLPFAAAADTCDVSDADMNFGKISGLDNKMEATGNFNVRCNNSGNIGGVGYCLYVMDSAVNLRGPGSDTGSGDYSIPVTLKNSKGQVLQNNNGILGPLWDWSNTKGSVSLNSAIIAQMLLKSLPTGNYIGTPLVNWAAGGAASADSFSASCASWNGQGGKPPWAQSSGSKFINLKFEVERSCTLQISGSMDFGKQLSLAQPIDSSAAFGIKCTKNTPYVITIANGLYYDTEKGSRAMQDAEGHKVFYDLYQDSTHHTLWGDSLDKGKKGKARNGHQWTTYLVHGRIPAQKDAPPGKYKDTVHIDFTLLPD